MKLEDFLINQNEKLEKAIKKISSNHQRTLFVTDNKKTWIGSITDGDLRSLLLRSGEKKDLQVKRLMNKKPLYFFSGLATVWSSNKRHWPYFSIHKYPMWVYFVGRCLWFQGKYF